MTDKERLEEIKEWFNADEEMHEFQIEWLIEQSVKALQYEKALKEIESNTRVVNWKQSVKIAREVLNG